ncbi:MAG: hypothetical protein LBV20_07690, partial [Treponema sp.]|nr:hypothetical protein [Treponema sp.]
PRTSERGFSRSGFIFLYFLPIDEFIISVKNISDATFCGKRSLNNERQSRVKQFTINIIYTSDSRIF